MSPEMSSIKKQGNRPGGAPPPTILTTEAFFLTSNFKTSRDIFSSAKITNNSI